jgi:hypothetical protein
MSGKWMIAQGGDGVSHRSLSEDFIRGMSSKPMSDFVSFHLSALKKAHNLLPWIEPWLGKDCKVLTPEGQYKHGAT